MKLFIKAGACSLSPHIILEESGLGYETESVDLATKVTEYGSDFLAINPKGYVPALLLDSGELLTEGAAIVQYLADRVPEKRLAPVNGTIERYQLQSWLAFIGAELHKSFSPFFNPTTGDAWRGAARANLERRLGYVEQQLTGQEYLLGKDFSVADAYLFTVLGWSDFIELDLAKWPGLVAYRERIASRPAVQTVLRDEGLA